MGFSLINCMKIQPFLLSILASSVFSVSAQSPVPKTPAARGESLPEILVTGSSQTLRPITSQQDPVGPYNQPYWTTQPNFTSSRVYVRPEGQVEIVQFWTPEFSKGSNEVEHGMRTEVEIGLPHRFQLDLYQNYGIDGGGRGFYKGSSVEVRYALADWGKIPLNPTLYFEWMFNDNASDAYEAKLLMGEVFAKRWQFAANISFENETGGAREQEWSATSALSYALVDNKLNIGLETLWERKTDKSSRGSAEYEFLIGPSFNFKPTNDTFINVAPLFGCTDAAPRAEIFVVAGIRFGGPRGANEEGSISSPASMFGR